MRNAFLNWLIKLALLLIVATVATSCATMTATGATDTTATSKALCRAFVPGTWSSRDTDDTIRAVKKHNRVWKELCR